MGESFCGFLRYFENKLFLLMQKKPHDKAALEIRKMRFEIQELSIRLANSVRQARSKLDEKYANVPPLE